jgi:hypothetical protein
MEAIQATAFNALAEVYTRVLVSSMKVDPHGLVNLVFIQLEDNQPKVKSASVMHHVLGAYPEEASIVVESRKITDSVLTHLRSMTVGRKYQLASMQGFSKRQLAMDWRLRYSALKNLHTAYVARGGLAELELIIADIDNSEEKQRFMNQFGGNKYHAMKEYTEILHEEGKRIKELVRDELPDLDLWSPSQSFGDDEAVYSEGIDSEANSSNVSVTSELATFDLHQLPEQVFDDLFD